jgi:hypothetical protein
MQLYQGDLELQCRDCHQAQHPTPWAQFESDLDDFMREMAGGSLS